MSPDPLLEELQGYVKNVKLGDTEIEEDLLKPILSNDKIFGVDLYGLGY